MHGICYEIKQKCRPCIGDKTRVYNYSDSYWSTIEYSWWDKNMLANAGDWGRPIPYPSHCLYKFPSKIKKEFIVAISSRVQESEVNILFKIIFTVSFRGTLQYKFSISYDVINKFSLGLSRCCSSETKAVELRTLNSLLMKGVITETMNFASLKQGLLYAAKIGRNWNLSLKSCLCIFGKPYKR